MENASHDNNRVSTLIAASSADGITPVRVHADPTSHRLLVSVSGDLPPGAFANPTASIGLTTVNGAATTAMRSDAAPALSQTISPTWTGGHTFRGEIGVENNDAILGIVQLNAGANERIWRIRANGGAFSLNATTDAGVMTPFLNVTRSAGVAAVLTLSAGTTSPAIEISSNTVALGEDGANGHTFLFRGSNSPWQVSNSFGNQGQVLTSTGNATSPSWGPALVNGQMTPVVTAGTNIASASANSNFTYIQVGNLVMIAGSLDVTASGAGASTLTFSLPVVSGNFANTHALNGSGAATDGTVMTPVYVRATSGAQTATLDWIAPNTNPNTIRFTAMFTT